MTLLIDTAPSATAITQPHETVPRFVHHVEIQTQDARLLASVLAMSMGMRVVAQARTSRGVSYALQSGQAVIVCTAPLPAEAGLDAIGDAAGFHAELTPASITRVRAIGLQVDNPSILAARAADLVDGTFVTAPNEYPAGVGLGLPGLLGDIMLRLLDGPRSALDGMPSGVPQAIPGFEPLVPAAGAVAMPGGVIGIDHVAVTVPDVPSVSGQLSGLLGWEHFRTFEEDELRRPLSAVTLASPTAEGLLTFVQPTRKDSVFQRALDANGGVSVHHIALRCTDIVKLVDNLARAGRWTCMPSPPDAYYDDLRDVALDYVDEHEFDVIRRNGLLLDPCGECALVQVFLPYLGDGPGVFFELIGRVQRRGERTQTAPPPGCGGFGDGNVTRLYDCLVQGIDEPPR